MIFLSYLNEEKDFSLFLCKQPFTKNELSIVVEQKEKFLLVKGDYQTGLFLRGSSDINIKSRKIFDSVASNDDKSIFEEYRKILAKSLAISIPSDIAVLKILDENKTTKEKEIVKKWKVRLKQRRV